jgi:hypothetical protein
MIKHNTDECKVGLFFDEGKVVKTKGTKTNKYTVNDVELSAVGRNVPDEVSLICNLDEGNFQGQFDAPFLLNESPGAVAKRINKIANIDLIDTMISSISSERRVINDRLQSNTDGQRDISRILQAHEGVEKFDEEVGTLNVLSNTLSENEKTYKELLNIHRKSSSKKIVDSVRSMLTKTTGMRASTDDLIKELDETRELISSVSTAIKTAWKVKQYFPLKTLKESYGEMKDLISQHTLKKDFIDFLRTSIEKKGACAKLLLNIKNEIETLRSETSFEVCPLCGKEVQ